MNFKQATPYFLLFFISKSEELERVTRGLDSQGFKALIEVGKLINNFGVENIENNVQQIVSFLIKNYQIIFYILIFIVASNILVFAMSCISVHILEIKMKKLTLRQKAQFQNSRQHSIGHDTNDFPQDCFLPALSDYV